MDGKKKAYTQAELDEQIGKVKREYELTLARQRERITELKKALDNAQKKIAKYESEKELVYKAITAALKKADDIERVSLIKYNQEIAQLKSFHAKWLRYYNKIIEMYPLDEHLREAAAVNRKISDVLDRAGDIEATDSEQREKLRASLDEQDSEQASSDDVTEDEYTDRSPAGFSFTEALHPKEDLKDIMRELGVLMDDE